MAPSADETPNVGEQRPGYHYFDGTSTNSSRMSSASYLATEEADVMQLPSPSLSPSPGILSPSLPAKQLVGQGTGELLPIANVRKYSRSIEQPVFSSMAEETSVTIPPLPISKEAPFHEMHAIPEEKIIRSRKASVGKKPEILKLSAAEIEELTSTPESLPVLSPQPFLPGTGSLAPSPNFVRVSSISEFALSDNEPHGSQHRKAITSEAVNLIPELPRERRYNSDAVPIANGSMRRPLASARGYSVQPVASGRMSSYTKPSPGQISPKRKPLPLGARPEPLDINRSSTRSQNGSHKPAGIDPPSPIPQSIPLPPMSIPTYLQLELSSTRPSPLYIYRAAATEYPYESSKIKFERLLNFLLLPPQLEQVLSFGSMACLDAWLYTFTILPLRFFKAVGVLIQWWGQVIAREARFISGFIYHGSGRMWHRRRERRNSSGSAATSRSVSQVRRPAASTAPSYQFQSGRLSEEPGAAMEQLKVELERKSRHGWGRRHRRTKSQPSLLSSYHKADLLQGAVIVCSCMILMKLDASRMYHSIRGQAAMKLYVIYNVLEVGVMMMLM